MSIRNQIGAIRIKTLSIQLVVFIVLMALVDIVLWVFIPIGLDTYQLAMKQSLPGVKSNIVYSSRKYGIRSLSAIADTKSEDQLRILCLGASTTEQMTQETRDTWCGLLGLHLSGLYQNSNA